MRILDRAVGRASARPLMKLLAIRLGLQTTTAKSLVIRQAQDMHVGLKPDLLNRRPNNARQACPERSRRASGYRSSKGFSLFELVLVIIIVAILMVLFVSRVIFYQEQAEKTAMIEVANAIQSALTMQYGQILTKGQASDVAFLSTDNPMNWLQKKPVNYAGEFYDPTPLTVASGNWMFDLRSRHLIYVPGNTSHFTPGRDGKKWIRFHAAVKYEPSRLPSLQNAPAELTGIVFEPVEPYVWF